MGHETGYEKKDVTLRWVVIPTAVSVLFLVASGVVLDQYFKRKKEEVYYQQVLLPDNPALRELREKEINILNNYRFDRTANAYQIPIERAMELQVLEQAP